MKLPKKTALLLAVCIWVSFSEAQNALPVLPSCASSCFTTFDGQSPSANTTCSDIDIKCICQDDTFLDTMICCLHEACSDSDRESAEAYARSMCKSMGVTMPSGLGCSTNNSSSAIMTGKTTSADAISLPTESSGTSSDTHTGSSGGSSDNSSGSYGGSSSSHQSTHHSSKAGLGAGLGVGLPAAAAVIGAVLYRLRRKKNPPAAPPAAPTLTNSINELPAGSNPTHFQPQPQPVGAYPQAGLAAYGALEKEPSHMGVTAASSPVHELAPQHQPQSGMPAYASPPVHELPLTGWQQPELPGSTVPPVHELPQNLHLNRMTPGNQPQQ